MLDLRWSAWVFCSLWGLFAGLCTATASGFVKRLGVLYGAGNEDHFLPSFSGCCGWYGRRWWWQADFLLDLDQCYLHSCISACQSRQLCLINGMPRKSCSIQFTAVFRDLLSTILGEILFVEPRTVPVVVGMIDYCGCVLEFIVISSAKFHLKKKTAASSTTSAAASGVD